MTPVSMLFYALTADDIGRLPTGFPILKHDTETDAYMLFSADGLRSPSGQVSYNKKCNYYALKMPPAGCSFSASKRKRK